jgi:hypothetical protein
VVRESGNCTNEFGHIEVLGDEIIVILPATSYGVTYSKPGRNQYVEAREGIAR